MKVLVTGGGGFLGSALIRALIKEGDYEIYHFSRHDYEHLKELGVKLIKGDIRNREDVRRALLENFDGIFHVAAKAGVWGSYRDYFSINFEGTKNLVELAQEAGVKKFVYTSTPSVVFGEEELVGVDETTPYPKEHLCHYATTKAMAEKLVLQENKSEFSTCAIRPHLIWGPGDPHLFPKVFAAARLGRLKIVGDGENMVDIVHVENAAHAHVLAMKNISKAAGEAYFIGQEKPVNLWNFINDVLSRSNIPLVTDTISTKKAYRIGWLMEKVWNLAGVQSPEPPMTRFVALNLGLTHYFSHEKAKRDLGYSPLISIEDGLNAYFKRREGIVKFLGEVQNEASPKK